MQLVPKKNDWKLANEVYLRFSVRPGSQHISSEFALAYLSALLHQTQPKKVLEFGAGIGTITYLLLTHPKGPKKIFSTEEHPYCLEQLEKNIPDHFSDRLKFISKDELSECDDIFDLIIIDSDFHGANIFNNFNKETIFFVEGSRKNGRDIIQYISRKKGFSLNFVNYNRGRAFLHFTWKKNRFGFSYPRIKLFKKIKGCWIGVKQTESG